MYHVDSYLAPDWALGFQRRPLWPGVGLGVRGRVWPAVDAEGGPCHHARDVGGEAAPSAASH